ncbi:MAG: phosphatidate cytidylyltransferase [Pseudomonadota bacterium]
MLRNRIITALILAPLALMAIFLLPTFWFAVLFAAVAGLACYEWAGLCGLSRVPLKCLYVGVFGVAAASLYTNPELHGGILLSACVLWGLAVVAVLLYPRLASLFRQPLLVGLIGLWMALAAWLALLSLRNLEDGSIWLLWMFILVWGADIGAYFAGRAFGKTALAPAVSPGKTWAGAVGGFLLAGVLCGGAVLWWQEQPLFWLAVTFLLIIVSVFGDLFESLLKRATGVKDSGHILPGHGGMLDRIDSLLAVAPVFAAIQVYGVFS